ncbi:hypothetical protein [Jannaschia sp. LMIT008]|uniref:hypothetical protein n=1 Tax=Jannaschia maritima TaxID=3032585 RepID=UPI002810B354|nr:hypothetical protein [Jannaschia sp. LMIT008]
MGVGVLIVRFGMALHSLRQGDETALLTLPLGAVLPGLLIVALLAMPPAHTVEGVLMRLGTAIHLLLILALPPLALHLALGLPVVFLVVELFQTRVPARIRGPLTRVVLA